MCTHMLGIVVVCLSDAHSTSGRGADRKQTLRRIAEMGFVAPSPVQSRALPVMKTGKGEASVCWEG